MYWMQSSSDSLIKSQNIGQSEDALKQSGCMATDNSEIPRSVSTGDLDRVPYRRSKRGPRTPQQSAKKYSPRKKFRWHDPDSGHTFTAGGILFYDDHGVWVIGEKDKNGIVYTDIGGRYAYEDGNIWTTIGRELREETYGLCEMFVSEIVTLAKKYPPVYVNGHDNRPVYICLVVPLSALSLYSRDHFSLNPTLFEIKRRKIISENPDVPVEYYSPCILTKLTFDELKDSSFPLSYRLKRILKFSPVFSSMPPRSEPPSPYNTDDSDD